LLDGIFSCQKNRNLGIVLQALEWKRLECFMPIGGIIVAIWYSLWNFGMVCGRLVYFWYIEPRKISQPPITSCHAGI
jgi:hypothetical protein